MGKKDKHKNKKSVPKAADDGDEYDERFAEIRNDPRFLEMPQKAKKVKIDKERFGKLFDKKSEFNTIGKYSKTGERIDQKEKTMLKYYRTDEDDGEDEDEDGDARKVATKKSKKKVESEEESEESLDSDAEE